MMNSCSVLECRSMQIAGVGTKGEKDELGLHCTILYLSTSLITPTPPTHTCQLYCNSTYKLPLSLELSFSIFSVVFQNPPSGSSSWLFAY